MSNKVKFGSKIGLIAATVGSAVGLGNVWRFPNAAQENGGAAFLLLYLACVFILGIPVMLSEFSLGRGGNADSVTVYHKLTPGRPWYLNGWLGVIASYLILSYYMVVAGWTVEYFWHSLTGELYDGTAPFAEKMGDMIATTYKPVFWTWVMIVLNMGILIKGVNKGVEKMSNILMPLLFVILVIFCCVALNLPKAAEGVEYFLLPDFSKIYGQALSCALGQAFFSLSLGMGILVTYSAYYPSDTKLTRTAVTVSSLGFLVALLMGLIIFPAVTSFGLNGGSDTLKGTALIFITLPEVFMRMQQPAFWSTLFFLLLAVAALTSTISLGEVVILLLQDRFKLSRAKACLMVMLPLFVLSTICSLSIGPWADITILGMTIFDFLDSTATNLLLPVCAFVGCIYVGWVLPRRYLQDELTNHGTFGSFAYPMVLFSIRFVAPLLIVFILFSQLL